MPYRCNFRSDERRWLGRALALQGVAFALSLLVPSGPASAQAAGQRGAAATAPVEITIRTMNGDVHCGPQTIRLSPQDSLSLQVVNRAERPIWFVAPKFFEAANVKESAGFTYDLTKGGFLAAPGSTISVQVAAPPPGEYYFSCFERTEIPSPNSSGFLLVTPAAR